MPTVTVIFTSDEIEGEFVADGFTFWGVCFDCPRNYFVCVEGVDFETALEIADEIIDGVFHWWFCDGSWLCEKCI